MKNNLVKSLFDTKALRVCDGENPFWYTSATIGPYYINTHFLYGDEADAVQFLEHIDSATADKQTCSKSLFDHTAAQLKKSDIYAATITEIVDYIKANINVDEIAYISGGERRDWFFSIPIAELLGKKHITIFKDGSSVLWDGKQTVPAEGLSGNVLHIADLITEASSYKRAWIPAVKGLGCDIKWSIAVVDRLQGGAELLEGYGIASHSLVKVDRSLFDEALTLSLIDKAQHTMLCDYYADPFTSMRDFLLSHPDFVDSVIKAGGRNAERATRLKAENLYNL